MQYSGNTGFVYIRIGSAQRQLDDCKSATISSIPGDFEGAGDIRGALDELKSVSLGEVKSKFSEAEADYEEADRYTGNLTSEFSELLNSLGGFGKSNRASGSNRAAKEIRKNNYDIYDQSKKDKKQKTNGTKKQQYVGSIVNGVGSIGGRVGSTAVFLLSKLILGGKGKSNKDNHEIYHQLKEDIKEENRNNSLNNTGAKISNTGNTRGILSFLNIGKKTDNFWENLNQQTSSTQKEVNQKLSPYVKEQAKKDTRKLTSYEKMLNDLNKKTEKTTKIANRALAKEQQRIQEETERVQASAQNTLVGVAKGGYKMGENIGDFIALRAEKLQEDHLRTIYSSNAEYEKANKEQYEKNIEKKRKETMSYVAKDHTEATFNRLYRENDVLKEIDERAYNAFKTTGGAYKIGEQVAPAIVATGAMVVAPEAAPTIIPIVIGMNSGGRGSEEYLQDKKKNSKEGIEQAYKDGEITKEEYDSYKYIWNLTPEEFSIAMNSTENQEDKGRLQKIYYMDDEWTTEENRDDAIVYGNTIGMMDAAQYAIGMNLYKFNPTNRIVLNSAMRVGIDTGLNTLDTPMKASARSLIDEDTDYNTEFEKLGGWDAVKTSAELGFAGSVFGEAIQYKAAKNKANDTVKQIYEMQGVSEDELDLEFKKSLNYDIMRGKINVKDALKDNRFLLNYAENNNMTKYLPKRIKTEGNFNPQLQIEKQINELQLKYSNSAYDRVQFRKFQTEARDMLRDFSKEEITKSLQIPEEFLQRNVQDFTKDQMIGWKCDKIFGDIFDSRDIVIVDNIDGVNIKTFRDNNFKKSAISLDELKDYINELPEVVRKSINEIGVYDLPCPGNVSYQDKYKIGDFIAYGEASYDNREIKIYSNSKGHKFFKNNDENVKLIAKETITHEGGHCLDYCAKNISNDTGWTKAMLEDKNISKFKNNNGVTAYANQALNAGLGNAEDFAESIKLYCMNRQDFEIRYPNRAKFLKNMLR